WPPTVKRLTALRGGTVNCPRPTQPPTNASSSPFSTRCQKRSRPSCSTPSVLSVHRGVSNYAGCVGSISPRLSPRQRLDHSTLLQPTRIWGYQPTCTFRRQFPQGHEVAAIFCTIRAIDWLYLEPG